MTTVIAVYSSDGCEGRCDARCHNATNPECDCICGGRNHGKGLKQAIENNRQMILAWLDTEKKKTSRTHLCSKR